MMAMRTALRAGARAPTVVGRRFCGLHNKCVQELEEEDALLSEMGEPTLPAGWSKEHKTGSGFFRVTKKENGVDLLVDCEFKSHEADSTHFTVVMKRNDVVCDFTLKFLSETNELSLVGMVVYPSWEAAVALTPQADFDRDNHYEGPTEDDLHTAGLATETLDFLKQHSIDEAFAAVVHENCQYLEQATYVNFLKSVKALAA
eukprot:Rhum_TRINITY_DN13745_c0_g2::Rhum_TRINITY_DN13745_c0_g2_i1::g.63599::m.63599/K15414/C1QBP; complement component 1 Q subcomponent-binding protein, mitochondrial